MLPGIFNSASASNHPEDYFLLKIRNGFLFLSSNNGKRYLELTPQIVYYKNIIAEHKQMSGLSNGLDRSQ